VSLDAEAGSRAFGARSGGTSSRRRAHCRPAAVVAAWRRCWSRSATATGACAKRRLASAQSSARKPDLLAALCEVFEPGDNVGLRNAAVEALGRSARSRRNTRARV